MDRRGFLWAGGAVLGAGALVWGQRNAIARAALSRRVNADVRLSAAPSPGLSLANGTCVLTAEPDEGPFFVRAPVREDRAGLPLTLRMQLVKADTCRPVGRAVVEVWHCDAAGGYSGYRADLARRPVDTMLYLRGLGGGLDTHLEPTQPGTFLRGAQATGADGTVEFRTIFPGWYEPRVPHVHAKVFVDGTSCLTTQLYFPDDLARDIHASHPDYAPHGAPPYGLRNDLILGRRPQADGLLLRPERTGDGLVASCRLGIA